MKYLKWLRILLALIVFISFSALFLDFTGTIPNTFHLFGHMQLVPAILGLSAGILGFWVVATILFGRVYCSVICPLGILQDFFAWIPKTVRGKKKFKYAFRPEMTKTRFAILVVFLLGLIFLPIGGVITVLDPYSNFGRMMNSIFRPILMAGNNLLAGATEGKDGIRFDYYPIQIESHAFVFALIVLALVAIMAVLFGRRYCNTICPIGTLLGLISRFSLLKIRLKSDCISCGICERTCKGECIDSKNKTVDSSRCVACFNCLGSCKRGSLVYSSPLPIVTKEQPVITEPTVLEGGENRRSFLRWSFFSLFVPSIAGSLGAGRSTSPPPDPSLPSGVSKIGYELTFPILPPGATNLTHFQRRCTGCHLCVTKCPANIIRPSGTELGLGGFMQPVVKFDHGFCNFDCTICTEICPSNALVPKNVDEKHRLQIGQVVFLQENCVVHSQETNCGACAEHCPTGAVTMIEYGDPEQKLTIPHIDRELCIGCGACEYICPVRPYRAIYVDGQKEHGEAKLGYDPEAKQETVELDDFGF